MIAYPIDATLFLRQVAILQGYTCDDEELCRQACNLAGITVRHMRSDRHGTLDFMFRRRLVAGLLLKVGLHFAHVAWLTNFHDNRIHNIRATLRRAGAPL